jgi:hypothetical protein
MKINCFFSFNLNGSLLKNLNFFNSVRKCWFTPLNNQGEKFKLIIMNKIIVSVLTIFIVFSSCQKTIVETPQSKVINDIELLNDKYKKIIPSNKTNHVEWNWENDVWGFLGGSSLCPPWCGIAFGVGMSALKMPTPEGDGFSSSDIQYNTYEDYSWYNTTLLASQINFSEYGATHNFGLDIINSDPEFLNSPTSSMVFDKTINYLSELNNTFGFNLNLSEITLNKDIFVLLSSKINNHEKGSFNAMSNFVSDMISEGLITESDITDCTLLYSEMLYNNLSNEELNDYTIEFNQIVSNSNLDESEKDNILVMVNFSIHSYSYWLNQN